jgi:integrase
MPIYRDKKSGRWMFDFDRWLGGQRLRKRRLLPAGWTRSQAEAYERKESAALHAIADGIAKPRHAIDEAVASYKRERSPKLKHGGNVDRELEATRDWWTGRPIEELPEVCAEYAEDQDGALAPATIKNRISYLRAACRYAWKRHKLCEHDPGARVVVPEVRNERSTYIDRRQMLALARACDSRPARAMIRVAWYSGMRLSEIEAARRDLEAGVFILDDTKNGERRLVPMHPRIRVCMRYEVPARYAFGYWFRNARAAVGMPDLHAHDLRHSAASELIRVGVDLYTVGAVLGHRSHASTKRYSHLSVQQATDAVRKMGGKPANRSPIAPQEKRPSEGASVEVEARAGVEPTYTDLQPPRALRA